MLYHFSDREDIDRFVPRAPLRHPHQEPLVYAMEERFAPLYYFPRNCPRIGLWVVDGTSNEERESFGGAHMRFYIDSRFEKSWREESLFRYRFDPADGFVCNNDYGDWVSRNTVVPMEVFELIDLPAEAEKARCEVSVVPSLSVFAANYYDFEQAVFTTTLHISMVRIGLLPDWPGSPGNPPTT